MKTVFFFVLAVFIAAEGLALDADDIAFVIICQKNEVSLNKCLNTEKDVRQQFGDKIISFVTHRDLSHDGDWTIFPLIALLKEKFASTPKWILFCTEHTQISLKNLLSYLEEQNLEGPKFIGLGLQDPEPTIIHHFQSKPSFQFPLFHSGFLVSGDLFEMLFTKLEKDLGYKDMDFSIDASYEFSSYLSALNIHLLHSDLFCIQKTENCATSVDLNLGKSEDMSKSISREQVYFAVKTCPQFHEVRIPVVKNTWGADVKHIGYFSDSKDDSIPTVAVNITPTHYGHCGKTREILRILRKKFKTDENLQWAVISDDDTLLSVPRLLSLLSVYNSSEALALGERYGYHLQQASGYNYLTGGGGVVLSRGTIMRFRAKTCLCASPSVPDDMFLFGVCLRRLDVSLIHVPLMHQARPNDYSKVLLSIGPPVSFHKHWMVDPILVYQQHLTQSETETESSSSDQHVEL